MRVQSEISAAIVRQLQDNGVGRMVSARELCDQVNQSEPALEVGMGSVYDTLGRMERDGWLSMDWRSRKVPSDPRRRGPRRERVYALAPQGRARLVAALTDYAQRSPATRVRGTFVPGVAD